MRWLDSITNFNGHEFVQTTRDSLGQGSLVCCSPGGHKESDTTEWLSQPVPPPHPRKPEMAFPEPDTLAEIGSHIT